MRTPIIIGNWKMYKTRDEAIEFIKAADKKCKGLEMEAGLAVPTIHLGVVKKHAKNLIIAAQNCHYEKQGAFTGETSIFMLKSWGITHVVIGHSERREMFNETDEAVNKKALALISEGLTPIICCGEPLKVYEDGKTATYVAKQVEAAVKGIDKLDIKNVVIAYEPIWAIGTGKTATPEIAQKVIKGIRDCLAKIYDQNAADEVRIQYGGSVKPENVKELLAQPDIDGALVGGASLEVSSFLGLVK